MVLWIANLNNEPLFSATFITNEKHSKNHKYLTSNLDLVLQKCCIHLNLEERQKHLPALTVIRKKTYRL